jgi:hypothetical protein
MQRSTVSISAPKVYARPSGTSMSDNAKATAPVLEVPKDAHAAARCRMYALLTESFEDIATYCAAKRDFHPI